MKRIGVKPVICALIMAAFAIGRVAIARAADLAAGKKTYDALCAGCHGASGAGDGAAGAALEKKPTNFTDCAEMAKVSDATLSKATKEGGSAVGLSGAMPPMGQALSGAEIRDVLAYLRAFCKR